MPMNFMGYKLKRTIEEHGVNCSYIFKETDSTPRLFLQNATISGSTHITAYLNSLITSKYVNKTNFWKLRCVVGHTYSLLLQKMESKEITDAVIEELMSYAPDFYFFTNDGSPILASWDTSLLRKYYGQSVKITAVEALKTYGIDVLEEAIEKTCCKV